VLSLITAMDYVRNNMAARTSDLRLYLDYNPDIAKFNAVSLKQFRAEIEMVG
jgi:ubiquitin carboxyl-terminal hydrolase 7